MSAEAAKVIEVKGLYKSYGTKTALEDVSFSVEEGEIVGLLGRNGAGKSTTMNILTGYLSSDAGDVYIASHDILEEPELAKRSIGYLPENPPLYPEMTVYEYLRFACRLLGMPRREIPRHLDEILTKVDIHDVKNRLIANLSKGYKQRVGIAKALCGNPRIVILDEPTIGLDPSQIVSIRQTIRDLGREHTVILSSHLLKEVSDVCTSVVILSGGKVIAAAKIKDLLEDIKNENAVLRVAGSGDIKAALSEIPTVLHVERRENVEAGCVDYEIESTTDIRSKISGCAIEHGSTILMLNSVERTLEDVFLTLTRESEVGVAI
jgi:ABC-2 type transport system ATP-binding protein